MRLLKVVERIRSIPDTKHTLTAWAELFEIGDADRVELHRAVARNLELLQQQVDEVEAYLRTSRIYDAASEITALRRMFSVEHLRAQFKPVKANLDHGVPTLLRMLSGMMPADSPTLSKTDMVGIYTDIAHAETVILKDGGTRATRKNADDIPDEIRTFLLGQVAALRRAADEYSISGIRAFQEASVDWVHSWGRFRTKLEPYKRSREVRAAQGLWAKIIRRAKTSAVVAWVVYAAGIGAVDNSVSVWDRFTIDAAERAVATCINDVHTTIEPPLALPPGAESLPTFTAEPPDTGSAP